MPRHRTNEEINQSIIRHCVRRLEGVQDTEARRLITTVYFVEAMLRTAEPRRRGGLTRQRNRALAALRAYRDKLAAQYEWGRRELARRQFIDDPETVGEA